MKLLQHGPVGGELHNIQAREELRHGPLGGESSDPTDQPHAEEGVDEVPSDVLVRTRPSQASEAPTLMSRLFNLKENLSFLSPLNLLTSLKKTC